MDNVLPLIECNITFIPEDEGGRRIIPQLSGNLYRPHIVVGDIDQRRARVGPGNQLLEEYLGVGFHEGPQNTAPGREALIILQLIYHPRVNYEKIQPGVTFTIREGPTIVGFGRVRRHV